MNEDIKFNTEVLKESKWIWYDIPCDNLVNSWMQGRRTFFLKSVPATEKIHITADSKYRLYINEQHVTMGPARGFQESWPYDTIDISRYLKKGKNVICALVHNYGVSNFQYIHKGWAGFLLISGSGISSNEKWRVRLAPGFISHTTRTTVQLGFQEFFDARKDDGRWLSVSYDDSKWLKPFCMTLGSMPWHNLQRRGIPLLKEQFHLPKIITSCSNRKSLKGYEGASNIVNLYLEEKRIWKKNIYNLKSDGHESQFEIGRLNKDSSAACCLDFGKEVVGSISLDISGAHGGEIVDSLVCESVNGLTPVIMPTNLSSHIAFGNRLVLKTGKTSHEQFEQWGFRYLILIFRNCSSKLKIGVQLRSLLYPLELKGSFQSSNSVLNRIYDMSVLTQQCCMLDAYVDCPWREQVQWWGDARIQGRNTFILSADSRLFARGIRQIGNQNVPNGLTYGHAPTIAHHCILPDFTLTWILTHWDYYWQTGDLSLFNEMKERIHSALSYFENQTSENGLLGYDERYWLFLDWVEMSKEGYPALYNLFYMMALKSAVKLFSLVNDDQSASTYLARLKKLTRSVKRHLFDKNTGMIFSGLTKDGKKIKRNFPHVYALAILLDILPENNRTYARKVIKPVLQARKISKNYPSPFFINYIFEAARKMNLHYDVIRCIERHWGSMLNRGLTTTEETWNARPGLWSQCHAWSAHPIVHFSETLLGINQTAPGWNEIKFSPVFSNIDFVKGTVATPLGVIEAQWSKTEKEISISLNLPDSMKCRVDIPGTESIEIKGRKHQWVIKHR